MLRSTVKSLARTHCFNLRRFHASTGSSGIVIKLLQPNTCKTVTNILKSKVNVGVRGISTSSVRFSVTEDTLDQSLHRLDVEIRRTGRINRREIEEILEDVRQLNSVTSNQSLMIIRCCGELVPEETFENRTRLVKEVWKTMENLKVPMDISHYNALLRVYLENEYKFNPTEFLQEISSKGLEPNRVTYQRLITRFCQDGDIEGASTILQHMKEKQLPINLHVFNALILGHAQSNDMESAEGIIGVMKQAGLEPNDDTYATLMRGYAKNGDIENIKRIVKECEQKDIFLVDRDFLEVIYTLTSSNHTSLVKEIIPMLKCHSGYNHEATNVILRLITIGQEDIAYELLKTMPRPMRTDELAPSGNFFIRQLVASNTPSEKILKFCNEMMKTDLNKYALLRACEASLVLKKFDKTFDLFEALKESGFPIRQHYFWPFFASSKTEKDVYDGLKCMSYMEVLPTVETLRDYIIPALLNVQTKSNATLDFVLEKLSNYTKIPFSNIAPAAMQYILQQGKLELAASFSLKHRIKFNNVGIRRALVDFYLKTQDPKALVQTIGSSGFEGDDSAREAMGALLMDLLETTKDKNKVQLIMPILQECLQNGLGLSNSTLEWIQNNLGEQFTPELSNIILQLTSGDLSLNSSLYSSPPRGITNYEEKSAKELEELIETANQLGRNIKGLKKALLIQYCREKNVEKATELYEELKSENFIFTSGMNALILDVYCHSNNLEKCRELYKNIGSREFFVLDDLKLLRYVFMLISNDQFDEAMEVIRSQSRDENRIPQGAQQNGIVWKILNFYAEKGDVEKVKEVFNLLKDRGLMPINNVVLGPLVKAYLVKDDLEGALKEFENCVNEYKFTPWKNELFCRLIKADDADRLQKVLDLSIQQYGELNSLYDLIFAFLECGKVRQAKKILESPGFRARNERLEFTCQRFLEEGKTEELEKLIEITRDVFNVDRNSLYFYLLKAYCKEGDANKALSVWTSFQEENIQPSDELMIYLANFLKKKNVEVPFVVPELRVRSTSRSVTPDKIERKVNPGSAVSRTPKSPAVPLDPTSVELRSYLENGELDKALELQKRIESEGRSLSIPDVSNLILKMIRADRLREASSLTQQMLQKDLHPYPRVLRYLVGRLATAGDIDTLTQFDSQLNANLKRATMLNSRICVAHVEIGKGKEYFEKYIKQRIEDQKTKSDELNLLVPTSAGFLVLRRHPELLSEFESLTTQCEDNDKNKRNLFNILWLYHLNNKDFDKAREILNNHLKKETDEEFVKFIPVIAEARLSKDEEIGRELMNQVLDLKSLSLSAKGAVISGVIDIMCEANNVSEGLEILKKHVKTTVPITEIQYTVLHKLKSKLEDSNINFPFQIPPKQEMKRNRRNKAESSDSSSDSDSD